MNKVVLLFCVFSLAFAADNLRLVDHDSQVNDLEGIVEVYVNNSWYLVCGDGFDADDSKVVCRSLGHDSSAVASGNYGIPDLRFLYTEVDCNGDEDSIFDCKRGTFSGHCSTHVASVDCTGTEKTTGTLGLEGGIIGAIIICITAIIGMILLFGACLWRNELCCAASSA